jgi:uncharacterized protein YlxW (UPF0749 family)
MQDYVSNPNFNPDYIRSKSGAAAGLCGWVVNICKYFRIYQVVAPKRAMLAEANAKLASAEKKLSGIRAKVADLKAKVEALEANLMKATEDKNAAVAQVRSPPQGALHALHGCTASLCCALRFVAFLTEGVILLRYIAWGR